MKKESKPQLDLKSDKFKISQTAINPFTREKVFLEPLPEVIDVDIFEAIKKIHQTEGVPLDDYLKPSEKELLNSHENFGFIVEEAMDRKDTISSNIPAMVKNDNKVAMKDRSEKGRAAAKAGREDTIHKIIDDILKAHPDYTPEKILDKMQNYKEVIHKVTENYIFWIDKRKHIRMYPYETRFNMLVSRRRKKLGLQKRKTHSKNKI